VHRSDLIPADPLYPWAHGSLHSCPLHGDGCRLVWLRSIVKSRIERARRPDIDERRARLSIPIWSRLGLSGRILLGLGLGVFVGLFVGEAAAALGPLADIYIRLMQMMVLPYLVTALVIAFGQLETIEARRLAVRGGLLLGITWAVTVLVLFAMPRAFPKLLSAAFYSDSLVQPSEPFSLADIYFTANPFASLSQNVVPAVVLFSCFLGVALIRLPQKERLLSSLRVWNEAIVVITRFVISLTPLGVFAIGAVAAGTMTPELFVQLQAYFVVFGVASVLLGFVILPLLVTAVTPFRYREVAGIARDALLTAFVTNNAFIVLPILVERCKILLERHGLLNEKTNSAAEVVVPVLFNFPNAGKLLTLLFIPFVAWLGGSPLSQADYPSLFAAGIPSYFAKAQIALPYLLDIFGLPQDLFQLYIPTTIVTGKFDSMVTAMNLLVFALLGAGAIGGFLKFERRRVVGAVLIIAASTAVSVGGTRLLLAAMIDTTYRLDQTVLQMRAPAEVRDSVVRRDGAAPDPPRAGETRLERVRKRGTLRIGYDADNLPFSFFNSEGELVGFDVELGARLAAELGVKAEFVPVTWPRVADLLDQGAIDLMPGVWYRPNWFGDVRLTAPYMIGTMALAVHDERRREFANVTDLRHSHGLRIGVPLDTRQVESSRRYYFGDADVEYVVIEFWKPFFEGAHPDVDAFLMPAEHASGWSLLHPEYTVVVPQPNPIRVSSAFGLARDTTDLADAVNEWIVFAKDTGLIDQAYTYWVLGHGAEDDTVRWSIMRDVLGWGTD
jgi:Na+/H+-dicarboxylate symporter/ABC-type amino acid transport substrate-binding protein